MNLENLKYPNYYNINQITDIVNYLENIKEAIEKGDVLVEKELTNKIPSGLITKNSIVIKDIFQEKHKNIIDDLENLFLKNEIDQEKYMILKSKIEDLKNFFEKYY